MSKILLENLKEYFTKDNYVLMLGLGFDQRYLSAFNSFPKEKAIQIIGISNVSSNELLNKQNITEFNKLSGGNVPIIGENARSILDIADGLFKYISSALQVSEQHLVIDITSLSHELLVLLIGILHNLKAMDRFTLLYVGASAYSFNTSNDNVWLSRGVRSIRSVLGFPGIMLPSKKLHLIILAGFEVERAKETIVRYEPASLSIGLGRRNESVSAAHHQKNKFFVEKLNLFVREQDTYCQDIQHFEFSCIDPQKTKDELLSHIATLEESEDRNIVICPLNTKLSTVGVALAALEKPEIQICYAEPEEYNLDGYAQPGSEVSVISLKKL